MYKIKPFLYKEKGSNNSLIYTSFNFDKSYIKIDFFSDGLFSSKIHYSNCNKIYFLYDNKKIQIKNNNMNIQVFKNTSIKIFATGINKKSNIKLVMSSVKFDHNKQEEYTDKKIYCEDLLYYVLVHDNNKDKIEKITNKLNENNVNNYLLVKGNSNENYVDEENKILHLNVVDVYENLPQKMMTGIKFIFENTNYEYIYKIDDSHSFNRYPLIKNYKEYDYYGNYVIEKDIYMNNWHFGKCSDKTLNSKINLDFKNEFAAGGFGYILSRKSMEIISKCTDYEKKELLEDKLIGEILFKNNVIINENIVDKQKQIMKEEKKILKKIELEQKGDTIYTKIVGGLGNQLFMIFNLISLSKKYNKTPQFYFDEEYPKQYLQNRNTVRKPCQSYKLLKNIEFKKLDNNIISKFKVYNEPEYKYNEIILDKDKNYVINGYFQSYKYFWDNKEEIKQYLYIDECVINEIRNKLSSFGKKIISIHVRLGDYVKLQDYHPVPPVEYYKKALSNYNLDNYQIILFSDDVNGAKEYLKELNLNFIDANEIYENDEQQFYMMSLSDVRVCANSSFSLMSCYINEIYNFKENCKYMFPCKWFGSKGPCYDIYDTCVINNNKFEIINYENKSYGIFLIGTGKYKQYFDSIIPNIKKYILPSQKKILFISTDDEEYLKKFSDLKDNNFEIISNYIKCRGFPADTMYRFEYFLKFKKVNFNFGNIKNIQDIDYLMFLNINLEILFPIEILPINNKKLFFVKHPGCKMVGTEKMFVNSIDSRNISYANIEPNKIKDKVYVFGAFNGGKTEDYLLMSEVLNSKTTKDDHNNIIAQWHDESYINYYRLSIDKKEYEILSYLYACPKNYDSNTYVNVVMKNHFTLRTNENIIMDYTSNITNDLLRFLYYSTIKNQNISINILNNKYIDSYRQGLLKKFHRIDINSVGIKDKKLNIIDDEYYELIYDENKILEFLETLNILSDKSFSEKYKNYTVVHVSNDISHYRNSLYNTIKNSSKKYVVVFHENHHYSDNHNLINDKIWDNLENVELHKFKNQEELIYSTILMEDHLFYDINSVFIILNISKFYCKKTVKVEYIYNFKSKDNNVINFLKNNFELKEINNDLNPGFSFIIRAKNEKLNVNICLKSLEPILTLFENSEVIFVDNNSEDNTYDIAKNILLKYKNTKVLRYNVNIPKCGKEHSLQIKINKHLSLGTYYKWCYSFSSKYNVIKWDCDFLCNIQELIMMINKYNLSEMDKDISVWFSGNQIFINNKVLQDTESYFLYNEPRVQSKLCGFEYEDSRDLMWETPYTKYLINNERNGNSHHYGFPTSYYIIRHIEQNKTVKIKDIYKKFDNLYSSNSHLEIMKEIKKDENLLKLLYLYQELSLKVIFYEMKYTDIMYKNIEKLRNIDARDKKIISQVKSIKNNSYNKNLLIKSDYINEKIKMLNKKEVTVCILLLTCEKYKERFENTKKKLLNNLNYKYFVVYADDNIENTYLLGNNLTVKCEECYENLPKKMLLAYEYLYNNSEFDYFIKIDDDTLINQNILENFIKNKFCTLDYLGGIAGGHVDKKWHFGKCKNKELNTKEYWNGYNGYWCGGGFGYILSRPAVSLLLKEDNYKYIYDEIYEDKSIGDVLRKENVLPQFEFLPKLEVSKKIDMKGDNFIFLSSH